jgi:hypothetical protein
VRLQQPFTQQLGFIIDFELLEQQRQFHRTEPGVYFGDLLLEVIPVAMTETSGDIDLVQSSLFLERHLVEDRIDRLFLGLVDEPTGIDDDDVVIFFCILMHHVDVIGPQLPAQHFAVDHIFTAPESDDIDLVPL